MKFIRQFLIILMVSFLGEVLHAILPLPVPANIYGLLIMLISLMTGIIKLDAVKETGKFLIETMPVMFIPAGVGIMVSYVYLKDYIIPIIFVIFFTTIVVMGVTGRVTQFIMEKEQSGDMSR